jgi:hypothetical protein
MTDETTVSTPSEKKEVPKVIRKFPIIFISVWVGGLIANQINVTWLNDVFAFLILGTLLSYIVVSIVLVIKGIWPKALLYGYLVASVLGAVLGIVGRHNNKFPQYLTASAGIILLGIATAATCLTIYKSAVDEDFRKTRFSEPVGRIMFGMVLIIFTTAVIIPALVTLPFSLVIYYGVAAIIAFIMFAAFVFDEKRRKNKTNIPDGNPAQKIA